MQKFKVISKIIFLLFTLFITTKSVFALDILSKPAGFINDTVGIISTEQKSILEQQLKKFQDETSNEIAVAIIPTLDGQDIANYSNELFRAWGIGSKKNNNGVLLLVVINDRKVRIEVGYGLEGALPDLLTKQIINNEITPDFKKGDYGTGIQKGVVAMMGATVGEYKATNKAPSKKFSSQFILFGLFILFQVLFSLLAPSKSWWLGGVIGSIGGGILGYILGAMLFGGIGFIVGGIIGLVFDYFVSKNYNPNSHNDRFGGFWGGAMMGGGSSGGSSFGGFGGGSSGGGGSSASW